MYELVFTFNRSQILLIGLCILHALALIAALFNTLSVAIQITLCVFVVVHFVWYWQQYAHQMDLGQLIYNEMIGWTRTVGGISHSIEILPTSIINPFLIIIHYQRLDLNVSSSTLLCFKDALPPTAFRQLTVQLKISAVSENAQSPDINT